MSYKTILVHLDASERRLQRLELALRLAETFDAKLIGLFALEGARIPSYALAEAGPTLIAIEEKQRTEATQQAEKQFRDLTSRRGALAEWRPTRGDPLRASLLSARYADLVVLGQPSELEAVAGTRSEFAEELLLGSGRPVLMVPYAGRFDTVGKRVLVAWNAGREAARAVADALPLLKRAEMVEVVAFEPRDADHGEVPGADIALYLARHGVKATAARQEGADIEVGEQILSRAADMGADLLVMGAYGHSRYREFVLGGVTRTLLDSMTIPVLMSH